MRFNPTAASTKMTVVRFRIPAGLEAKYQAVAEQSGVDIQTVYRQALEYAATDEPAPTVQADQPSPKRGRKPTEA